MIMSSSIEPDPSVMRLVTEISRLFARDFSARVGDYGLTHTQWRALAVLSRNEGIKQAVLADLLQIQPISLGRLIDRLEAAGWVERRRAAGDRRAIQLYLTPKVGPVLDQMTVTASLTREAGLADFDAGEREQLIRMLQRLKASLVRNVAHHTASPSPGQGRASDER